MHFCALLCRICIVMHNTCFALFAFSCKVVLRIAENAYKCTWRRLASNIGDFENSRLPGRFGANICIFGTQNCPYRPGRQVWCKKLRFVHIQLKDRKKTTTISLYCFSPIRHGGRV